MTTTGRILRDGATGIVVDLQRAPVRSNLSFGPALAAMAAIEAGAAANLSEGRRVGHYWLRDPSRAPTPEIGRAIEASWAAIESIDASGLDTVLLVGIGGSALGPELVFDALGAPSGRRLVVLDTVDSAGVQRKLDSVTPSKTLVIVASKSGSTSETLTGLEAVEARYREAGVPFDEHAVAITMAGTPLAHRASTWRATIPLWPWVGGRTSITSAIGLLPMHLLGLDTRAFLSGASAMDAWTRRVPEANPAAQLAALWATPEVHTAAFFPYADALRFLGRYAQQLVMESLGKTHDRQGAEVRTGLTVVGNKGSADQHALIQQLRGGPRGVACQFISATQARPPSPELQAASDLQFSLMSGTQHALAEVGQPVVSIHLPSLNEASLGALIALLERAVGLTAELLDINAYDQPGVEAGKVEARNQLQLVGLVETALTASPCSARDIASRMGLEPATVWRICSHLEGQGRAIREVATAPVDDLFSSRSAAKV